MRKIHKHKLFGNTSCDRIGGIVLTNKTEMKQIKSIEHLIEEIEKTEGGYINATLVLSPGLKSSKFISWDGTELYFLDLSDNSEEYYTMDKLKRKDNYVNYIISKGSLYIKEFFKK